MQKNCNDTHIRYGISEVSRINSFEDTITVLTYLLFMFTYSTSVLVGITHFSQMVYWNLLVPWFIAGVNRELEVIIKDCFLIGLSYKEIFEFFEIFYELLCSCASYVGFWESRIYFVDIEKAI